MNKSERILIISNTIDAGGAETFVMKLFRTIDINRYIFDFIINKKDSNFYLYEIEELGGKVYYGESKSKSLLKSFKCIYQLVKRNGYRTILCIAVHPAGFLDLLAARMGGAKMILVRSTNSHAGKTLSDIIAWLSRPIMRMLSSVMLAPSKEAGEWLFGHKAVTTGKVVLLNNGVDTKQYSFASERRERIRKELGIKDDTTIVGHVGRFNHQKNHTKLLGVFSEMIKIIDCELVLVGNGELKGEIEQKTQELKITDRVKILGIRNDVPDLLSAFDIIVFPSFYEGMPNTIIEAQAADLPCIISDSISHDVKITENVFFMPLDSGDDEWASVALSSLKKERKDRSDDISKKGYSIEKTTQILISYFK